MLRQDDMDDRAIQLRVDEREVVLVCGDRGWTDVKAVAKILQRYDPHRTILRVGGARGADRVAEQLGRRMGFEIDLCEADWSTFGKAAGFIRNRHMAHKDPKPSRVWALHDDLASSKGTKDMVKVARRANIPVTLVKHRV